MIKLSKNIALPLIAVLIIGTGIGGYFLFRNFQIPEYFVDKYPELIEYCDTQESKNGLKVSCKALMLDIKPNDGSPSLTSLVISNDEELKEYTVTEEEEVFSFTNDILQFKKLKPVIINIQYTKGNLLKYSLSSITFENIPDAYIQEIVNRDIEEIMGMDRSSTTILNSFDFCPRPEILPDYVVKKEEYTKYWEENILSEEEYEDISLYTIDDNNIRGLFLCESMKNIGINSFCRTNPLVIGDISSITGVTFDTPSEFSSPINKENSYLKIISLTRDSYYLDLNLEHSHNEESKHSHSMLMDTNFFRTNTKDLITLLDSKGNLDELSYCAAMLLYKDIAPDEDINRNMQKYQEYLEGNVSKISSSVCIKLIGDQAIDINGIYLKLYYSDKNQPTDFEIFEDCNNLKLYFDN